MPVGQRSKRAPRCATCLMLEPLCVCAAVQPIDTRTHVAVVYHRREVQKPTNTGRLAELTLRNSSRFVRGHRDAPADLSVLADPGRRLALLFPREGAETLDADWVARDPRPVTLLVPDGSWTQARRCVRREPLMAAAEAVVPPAGDPTRYRLRAEHVEGGLGTGEAIARALRVLEGDDAADALMRLFDLVVERTLASRQPPAAGAERGGSPPPTSDA